ncbi:MAG: MotA/TolQ/ExbB proton channel family protein [Ruminococcus sp.]|nr:MotA/TolQ/ExbB proton channel family protein [Ruminococcus sp.]
MKDILFMNIMGYDLIIFIFFGITFIASIVSLILAGSLHRKLNPPVDSSNSETSIKEINRELSETKNNEIKDKRKKAVWGYSVFTNFIAIFPLLGILGTVYSLLGLVSDSSNITGNFYSALTSTFWGIVFAIIFKLVDAFSIAPLMEENEKDTERFLNNKNEKAKK